MSLLTWASDLLLGARGCLFTFHRVAWEDRWFDLPNRDFYVNLAFLDKFLEFLRAQDWDVVTMEEAVRRMRMTSGKARKFVNFSIDDCYRDTFEDLIPLFRRHDAPITLFVTTGIPDGTLPLCAAGLEEVLATRDRIILDDGVRILEDGVRRLTDRDARAQIFQDVFASWDGPEAAAHYIRFCAANNVDIDAMHWKHAISWEMLERLKDDPLVEIGGHSITHPHIAQLNLEQATYEIAGCRQRLQDRLGLPINHFAFPYGRRADCGPRDFALARTAGFVSAATTSKGLVRQGQTTDHLPRITLNGKHQSLALMHAHLTGVSALASKLLGRV